MIIFIPVRSYYIRISSRGTSFKNDSPRWEMSTLPGSLLKESKSALVVEGPVPASFSNIPRGRTVYGSKSSKSYCPPRRNTKILHPPRGNQVEQINDYPARHGGKLAGAGIWRKRNCSDSSWVKLPLDLFLAGRNHVCGFKPPVEIQTSCIYHGGK